MTPWSVFWTPAARKDLKGLDAATLRRVTAAVKTLAETGRGDVKKLTDRPGHRLRVGDWRVIFKFDADTHALRIGRVLNRREAY